MYTIYFLYSDHYEKIEMNLVQCQEKFGPELWRCILGGKFDNLYHVVKH